MLIFAPVRNGLSDAKTLVTHSNSFSRVKMTPFALPDSKLASLIESPAQANAYRTESVVQLWARNSYAFHFLRVDSTTALFELSKPVAGLTANSVSLATAVTVLLPLLFNTFAIIKVFPTTHPWGFFLTKRVEMDIAKVVQQIIVVEV